MGSGSPKDGGRQLKVLVSVKRVIDFNVKIRVKADNSGVETANIKMSLNPFDEIAVEEAVQLKEKGIAQELVAVSIGAEGCQETLRTALAMGMDRAIHIHTNQDLEPISVAQLLQYIVTQEQPNLIIMGKQAIDDDCNQTGQMLAGMLKWPQATFASHIEFKDGEAFVTREVDGGLETVAVALPALITTDLSLNKPRYLSMPSIMKAKQKKIENFDLDSLSVTIRPHSRVVEVKPPEIKQKGIMVNSAAELVAKLHEEAKVI
jgi:electron transfer flavoprotein beta subunit